MKRSTRPTTTGPGPRLRSPGRQPVPQAGKCFGSACGGSSGAVVRRCREESQVLGALMRTPRPGDALVSSRGQPGQLWSPQLFSGALGQLGSHGSHSYSERLQEQTDQHGAIRPGEYGFLTGLEPDEVESGGVDTDDHAAVIADQAFRGSQRRWSVRPGCAPGDHGAAFFEEVCRCGGRMNRLQGRERVGPTRCSGALEVHKRRAPCPSAHGPLVALAPARKNAGGDGPVPIAIQRVAPPLQPEQRQRPICHRAAR